MQRSPLKVPPRWRLPSLNNPNPGIKIEAESSSAFFFLQIDWNKLLCRLNFYQLIINQLITSALTSGRNTRCVFAFFSPLKTKYLSMFMMMFPDSDFTWPTVENTEKPSVENNVQRFHVIIHSADDQLVSLSVSLSSVSHVCRMRMFYMDFCWTGELQSKQSAGFIQLVTTDLAFSASEALSLAVKFFGQLPNVLWPVSRSLVLSNMAALPHSTCHCLSVRIISWPRSLTLHFNAALLISKQLICGCM